MTEEEKAAAKEEAKKQGKDALIQLATVFMQSPQGQALIATYNSLPISEVKAIINDPEKFRKYLPVIKVYTTEGRIYDKIKNEPIVGFKVEPKFVLYPVKSEQKSRKVKIPDPDGKPNKLGIVPKIEVTQNYLKWTEDDSKEPFTKTDNEGRFKLQFGVPVIPGLDDKILGLEPFNLYIDDEGKYAPDKQVLIDGNGEVPQELPIKALLNIKEAAKEAKKQAVKEALRLAGVAAQFLVGIVNATLVVLRLKILSFANVVMTKLLPLAFELFILFGIAKEEQANQAEAKCPNNEVLRGIIKKRNSVVKQINNMYKIIITNTAIAGLFLYLSLQLKQFKGVISSIALPLSVPPGVGVPYSLVAAFEDIKEALEKFIDISDDIKKALLISLVFLIIALVIILRYLKVIDELIEGCVEKSDEISMVEIDAGLLALQKQDEDQGSPLVANVNGFTMSVEVVEKSNVDEYYQRQAVAKNSQGIIILKGDPSFSATDQILIDELVFYIEQNNLKAF
tara:strand:- start:4648 stop:6174 length:1527 start_codon:yes stop_codon:yes gene_type:complete